MGKTKKETKGMRERKREKERGEETRIEKRVRRQGAEGLSLSEIECEFVHGVNGTAVTVRLPCLKQGDPNKYIASFPSSLARSLSLALHAQALFRVFRAIAL